MACNGFKLPTTSNPLNLVMTAFRMSESDVGRIYRDSAGITTRV